MLPSISFAAPEQIKLNEEDEKLLKHIMRKAAIEVNDGEKNSQPFFQDLDLNKIFKKNIKGNVQEDTSKWLASTFPSAANSIALLVTNPELFEISKIETEGNSYYVHMYQFPNPDKAINDMVYATREVKKMEFSFRKNGKL